MSHLLQEHLQKEGYVARTEQPSGLLGTCCTPGFQDEERVHTCSSSKYNFHDGPFSGVLLSARAGSTISPNITAEYLE